jgi:hypothetical protein
MTKANKDLLRYDAKTFQLMPLHRPKAVVTLPNGTKKPVGKAPFHKNWTTRDYNSAKVIAQCAEEGRNVGVRLTDDLLVIDVDPRNGGDVGFLALCADLGIDGDKFPRVITGSGGFHCYMTKPADALIRDTLDAEEYNGVEFKSKGRQVVAAGSIHPNGNPYYWSPDHPAIEDGLPKVPKRLLTIITRPPRGASVGGGNYTPEQIAQALEKLDVADFNTNDKWLPLMMACHHGSAGEARQEWVDWSTGDPAFAKDAYMIGKRWDSLHAERNDGVTVATLNKYLRDAGAANSQAAAVVDDDEFPDDDDDGPMPWDDLPEPPKHKLKRDYQMFDEPDEEEGEEEDDGVRREGYPEESLDELNKLNRKYVALFDSGKFRIMFEQDDPALERKFWQSIARHDFESMFLNRNIERDMTGLSRNAQSVIPLGEAWCKWPGRRTVDGVIFEPEGKRGEGDRFLNLWSGWGMQPDLKRKGSWKWMRELISDVICDGDERIDSYIMNWLAMLFQRPSFVPGVALVFRGGQGVGKGTVGNAIAKIVGPHAMAIRKAEHLTGRFNAHFRNTLFLFADEVVAPYGDKTAEATMKGLITEPTISIERKGVDIAPMKNYLHVIMASNEKWVVPAAEDERRYMVQHVTRKWQQRKDKFDKLLEELRADGDSGYRAMLTDLQLFHEIPENWKPRDFPITPALIEQKLYTLSPVKRFFHNALMQQRLGFTTPTAADWSAGKVKFFLEDFKAAFTVFCRENNINAGSAGRASLALLKNEIKDLFPSADVDARLPVLDADAGVVCGVDGKAMAVIMPNMVTSAREFERACGIPENTIMTNDPEEHGFG